MLATKILFRTLKNDKQNLPFPRLVNIHLLISFFYVCKIVNYTNTYKVTSFSIQPRCLLIILHSKTCHTSTNINNKRLFSQCLQFHTCFAILDLFYIYNITYIKQINDTSNISAIPFLFIYTKELDRAIHGYRSQEWWVTTKSDSSGSCCVVIKLC